MRYITITHGLLLSLDNSTIVAGACEKRENEGTTPLVLRSRCLLYMTYRAALDQMAMNIMDERKRPAKESAGSPSPKRKNSLATGSRAEDADVPPLVPAGQQAKMIRYNDEIHLSIDLCPLMKRIMDTWPVQRLHDLKQLGTANMVYACATHTRFEHSVGVAHLAREMCKRLQLRHPSFGVTNKDVLCVTLAGLLRKFVAVLSVSSV
jgi:hypothetical protein